MNTGIMPIEETDLGLHDGPDLYFVYRGGAGSCTWHFAWGGVSTSVAHALEQAKINPDKEPSNEGDWLVVPASAIHTFPKEW